MTEPALSLVVTTVGRPQEFERLVRSVLASEAADRVELVLVDQSADQSCAAVLDRLAPPSAPGRLARTARTTSGRGASHGRNTGMGLVTAPVVGFPDDNCWYPPGTLLQVVDAFTGEPGLAGLSGRQLTEGGAPSMLRWKASAGPITRHNFLRTSIMSTMFFRRADMDAVGHFDETMGVGSFGWYGAGEESDLVLRVLAAGGRVRYDPALVVLQEEPRDAPDDRFVAKMLSYGCGMGNLWRLHGLSRVQLAYYAVRKVGAVVLRGARGRRVTARADAAYLRGLLAGLVDRPPRELRERAEVAGTARPRPRPEVGGA
ncbi:glycosyltransferase [Pseudokineococcus basanitobsidens]|uniref:Glycosyltransferase n=1 Tax=Pseudokineococcus basanitobsidens TaxID=1926649 RepID=A0ABU8RJM7_9ACTN